MAGARSMRYGYRPLPAPLDSVVVRCIELHRDAPWAVVEYRGCPEDLVASGVVEPGMEQSTHCGRARFDSLGDKFWRVPLPRGRIRIRRDVSMERALTMVGVRGADIRPLISEERRRRNPTVPAL